MKNDGTLRAKLFGAGAVLTILAGAMILGGCHERKVYHRYDHGAMDIRPYPSHGAVIVQESRPYRPPVMMPPRPSFRDDHRDSDRRDDGRRRDDDRKRDDDRDFRDRFPPPSRHR